MSQETIHGYKIVGSVNVRISEETKLPYRVILVDRGPERDKFDDRWVTAGHWEGDKEWNNGHYFGNQQRALEDFFERTRNNFT